VKNFRVTLFLRASASCSKILNIKSRFNTCSEKFHGKLSFSGQAQSFSKIQLCACPERESKIYSNIFLVKNIFFEYIFGKNIFNTVKNFRANPVFQGKRKLLKNPIHFQYNVFSVYLLGCGPCNLG